MQVAILFFYSLAIFVTKTPGRNAIHADTKESSVTSTNRSEEKSSNQNLEFLFLGLLTKSFLRSNIILAINLIVLQCFF